MNRRRHNREESVGKSPSSMHDEGDDSVCILCFKPVEAYSFGLCDHPVCFECSSRMRVLCKQNECPICRQDMPVVVFSRRIVPYAEVIDKVKQRLDEKYNICFDGDETRTLFSQLLEHRCSLCDGKSFQSFVELKQHVRRTHQLSYCDLCVANLKIFSSERKFYSRPDLVQHRKKGDPDDKSHRGHPLCEFCDVRFMDNDELFRHLRRDHLYCHICDADGLHQYYSSYKFLRVHYRKEHFLCEEGSCINEQFTSVFRTQLDFKAHQSSVHGHEMGKQQLKQTRSVALEFTLVPRERPPGGPGSAAPHHRSHHNRNENGNNGVTVEEPEPVVPARSIDTGSMQEFPCLGGMEGQVPSARGQPAHRITPRSRHLPTVNDENFPALGGPSSSTGVSLSVSQPQSTQVSIRVHSKKPYKYEDAFRPESFPSLGGSVVPDPVSWTAQSHQPPNRQTKTPRPATSAPQTTSFTDADQFPSLGPSSVGVTSRTNVKKGSKGQKSEKLNNFKDVVEKPRKVKDKVQEEVKENLITANVSKRKEKDGSKKFSNNGAGNLLDKNDFPCLPVGKRPPPGFALPRSPSPEPAVRRVPPGLPPPGFAPPPSPPSQPYLNPKNFAKRNKRLLNEVQSTVSTEVLLSEFRMSSSDFRSGSISAADYIDKCLRILGRQAFNSIFPELLVLLPDIRKQQEVWEVLEPGMKKGLEVCADCRQLVSKSDIRDHSISHTSPLELPNFPPLPRLSAP